MNRRRFFQATGATALALSLPLTAKAADGEQEVVIEGLISANHGHALDLSISQVVELFGLTNGGVTQEINIQGESGHPHSLQFNQEMLIALLADKEIEVESSTVAGHAHRVLVSIDLIG